MPRIAFGPFTFDSSLVSLTRDGEPMSINARGAALLEALLDARGGIVGRNALIEAAWQGLIVDEANLTVQIGILRKLLGKQPDGREWIATVPRVGYRLHRDEAGGPGGVPTIAILPFANLSSDPDQAYFAEGMVEELTTALSRFKTLAVISRNSTLGYGGHDIDLHEAAETLGVRYLLAGSVRRAAARVRVTAQLIEGATGAHLWADRFEGEGRDLFDFQDSIAESVIGLVEPKIRKAEIERARRKHPDSLDAWGLYVRALPLVYGDDLTALSEAIVLLERSIALDPGYAPALAICAWAHEKRYSFGTPPPGVDDARECLSLAARALEAGSDDATVLALVGWMQLVFKQDWEGMMEMISRAVELNPNNAFVLNTAGMAHYSYGRPEEAIALYDRALRLSPGAPDNFRSLVGIATAHFNCRRYDDAIRWARRSAETPNAWAYRVIAAASGHLGHLEDAQVALVAADAIRPETIEMQSSSPIWRPDVKEHWLAGLRKAGMRER
jgi:TolB-like protein/DNA-binding winged helix-turn-helix (wHTH) protein